MHVDVLELLVHSMLPKLHFVHTLRLFHCSELLFITSAVLSLYSALYSALYVLARGLSVQCDIGRDTRQRCVATRHQRRGELTHLLAH